MVRVSMVALAMAAALVTVGCAGLFLLPRIDLPSDPPDPHATYASLPQPDGSRFVVGVDTSAPKYVPWVAHVAPDQTKLWQHSYGVLGQGGHGWFVSGATLADGSLVAAGGAPTVTTLALASFDAGGSLRWAWERELPAPILVAAKVVRAGEGALALVPVKGGGGAVSLVLVRVDAKGAVAWARRVEGLGEVIAARGDDALGLAVIGRDAQSKGDVLTRLSSTGEVLWARSLPEAESWGLGGTWIDRDGSVLLASASVRCDACRTGDITVARFDGKGHIDWRTTIHRPPPEDLAREYEENHPDGWPTPPPFQLVAPRPAGGAFVAATVPSRRPRGSDLAFLELGPDGALLSQRAAPDYPEQPAALSMNGATFVVESASGKRCVSPPPPAVAASGASGASGGSLPGCGAPEHPLSLRGRAAPFTPVEVQLTTSEVAGATRDLLPEMKRTER